jgi:hypothetical protein
MKGFILRSCDIPGCRKGGCSTPDSGSSSNGGK